MRRIVAALVVAGLAAGASACGGDSDPRAEAAVDRFCSDLADYLGLQEVLHRHEAMPPVVDPRALLASLARVRAPLALADAWRVWQQSQQEAIAIDAAQAAHGGGAPWIDRSSPAGDEVPEMEVDTFWERDCVADRGYEPAVPFSRTDPELPPYRDPPNGGEIRVVEYGLTTASSYQAYDSEYHGISYGVIVENTSDHVAAGVQLDVDVVDGSGGGQYQIPLLLPGQRYGVAGDSLERGTASEPLGTDLEVTVSRVAEWWPVDHPGVTFRKLTIGEVVARPPGPGGRVTAQVRSVTVTIESAYRVMVSNVRQTFPYERTGSPHVIFRDAAGEIVGGASARRELQVPPGRSHALIYTEATTVTHAVAIDTDRTEVYFLTGGPAAG